MRQFLRPLHRPRTRFASPFQPVRFYGFSHRSGDHHSAFCSVFFSHFAFDVLHQALSLARAAVDSHESNGSGDNQDHGSSHVSHENRTMWFRITISVFHSSYVHGVSSFSHSHFFRTQNWRLWNTLSINLLNGSRSRKRRCCRRRCITSIIPVVIFNARRVFCRN